jgi:hypothetical protein
MSDRGQRERCPLFFYFYISQKTDELIYDLFCLAYPTR